jgi:hypothetical protein
MPEIASPNSNTNRDSTLLIFGLLFVTWIEAMTKFEAAG